MGFGEQEFLHIKVVYENHIAIIQFNRSDSMNAANRQMVDEYHQAVEQANKDSKVKALIITGNDKVYCVGGNFNCGEGVASTVMNKYELYSYRGFHSKPKIAMISGYCLGGAVQQAMACDMRVASPSACFEMSEEWGSYRQAQAAGYGASLAPRSRIINAREALRIGLVNMVVEQESLKETTMGLACLVSKRSTGKGLKN
ncbi:MAG: enoyl-CoA hydratase/isomerase family protein [Syntrophomonadaceae bacterium]